ncbi:MAG TPA: metal ABC transporter substrate-binding protein [Longimicrobiales bacterium]|nr:metal ABC transporter substrate-binding protein [Longimicrobiales bacterium]
MTTLLTLLAALVLSPVGPGTEIAPSLPPGARAPVRVVATLPVYADLTRLLGGDQVEVSSIANPNEDSHFVRPKPSFALDLRRADMFITTGLDLELWVPTLLDRAGNSDVLEGGRGYVTAHTGVELLDIPSTTDRSAGDIHIYGNPHLATDPLRALQVARNITTGLDRVAPDRAAAWDQGLAALTDRIHRSLFGDTLVDMLGGETLEQLALQGRLFSFLQEQELDGQKLIEHLGGWLETAEPFRGKQLICYHKNWAYLEERFGLTCADYVEAKPGIPPTPGHVADLIRRMQNEGLNVLLAASYFDRDKVESVARRGGATAVIVPMQPGALGTTDYFDVVDLWVQGLARAFGQTD